MRDEGLPAKIAGITLVLGILAGCSASDGGSESESSSGPTPKVVLPGSPGDEPKVAGSAKLERIGRSPQALKHEVSYVRMMIPHHQQAVDMTALAPQRAQHPQVRALAERIGGSQGPEIEGMRGWLSTKTESGEHDKHEHDGAMPGMATPEQLDRLKAAHGTEFDRLFLELMIAHHRGAVTMATDLLAQGLDERLHGLAQDVLVTQKDEIATMQRLLGELGA